VLIEASPASENFSPIIHRQTISPDPMAGKPWKSHFGEQVSKVANRVTLAECLAFLREGAAPTRH
jgi:hypothetical protein